MADPADFVAAQLAEEAIEEEEAEQMEPEKQAEQPRQFVGSLSAPRDGKADNLTLIKGIGKVNEQKLHAHGIYHFDQIAVWTADDVTLAETYLSFDGRIAREDWVGQASQLAAGKATEFSTRVEAGDVPTSHKTASSKTAKTPRKPRKGAE